MKNHFFRAFVRLNVSDFYIMCWLVLLLFESKLGLPYEDLIASYLLKILLAWSFFYFALVCKKRTSIQYLKGLKCITVIYMIYGVECLLANRLILVEGIRLSPFSFLSETLRCVLPIFTFYYYNISGKFNRDKLIFWIPLFVIFAVVLYFLNRQSMMVMFNREDLVNNSGYIVLTVIPLVAFLPNKQILRYLYLLTLSLIVFSSVKRGAILCCILCIFLYTVDSIKTTSPKKRWLILGVSVGAILSVYYLFNAFVEQNAFFAERLDDFLSGESSGRDYLYSKLYENLKNRDLLDTLFGTGAYTTVFVVGKYAHNDWLEIATCMGAVGVVGYLYYWIKVFKQYKIMPLKSDVKLAFLLLFSTAFAKTLFSMSFNDIHPITACIIGFCVSQYSNNNLKEVK